MLRPVIQTEALDLGNSAHSALEVMFININEFWFGDAGPQNMVRAETVFEIQGQNHFMWSNGFWFLKMRDAVMKRRSERTARLYIPRRRLVPHAFF